MLIYSYLWGIKSFNYAAARLKKGYFNLLFYFKLNTFVPDRPVKSVSIFNPTFYLAMNYTRRTFIKNLGLLYGSLLFLPACSTKPVALLNAEEVDCLNALCNQMIPDDEHSGAVKAGVVNFIEKQLGSHLNYCKNNYHNGITSLQAYCQSRFGKKFEQLPSDQQIRVMQEMEENKLTGNEWKEIQAGAFFAMVLKHCMMGFYGAPRHGGNKDYASYRMLRLDVPLIIGQNRYPNEKR